MPRAGHITLLSPMERHQNVCKSNEKCNPPPSWNWSKIQSTKIFRWCRREYGQWPVGLALTKPGGSSVIVIKTTTGARPLKRAPEFPSEGGCAVPRCSHSTSHVTLKRRFKKTLTRKISAVAIWLGCKDGIAFQSRRMTASGDLKSVARCPVLIHEKGFC